MSLILTILYVLPSVLLLKKWHRTEPWWQKIATGLIYTTTLVPLVVFYSNYFLSVKFNLLNSAIVIILVNGVVVAINRYKSASTSKVAASSRSHNFIYAAAIILSFIVFSYPYVINHQPIIGGDSPHYLKNSQRIITTGYPDIVFDRSIIYFLPALINLISGISIENVLKITVTLYEVAFIVISLTIAQKFIASKLLLPFAITLIFSSSILNMSKYTIPFFIALSITLFLIERIISTKKKFSAQLFIPLIWGILFNLHGVIAFASFGLIVPVLMYVSWYYKTPVKKIALWLVLFLITSQPLVSNHWAKISAGVIAPIQSSILKDNQTLQNSTNPETQWVDEFTTNQTLPLNKFPAYKESFLNGYSLIVLIFSVLGLLIAVRRFKKPEYFALATATLGLVALTQQEFLGMNWFTVRFIFAAAPFLYILAFFGFSYVLDKFPKLKLLSFYGVVAIFTLPAVLTLTPKITSLSANITQTEYQFMTNLKQYLNPSDVVFVAGPNSQWLIGIIPGIQVFDTHHEAVCGDQSALKRITTEMWDVGQAFSQEVSLPKSIEIFKKYSQDKEYYVYLDTQNYRCINGDLFPANLYAQVARQDDLYLLKYK